MVFYITFPESLDVFREILEKNTLCTSDVQTGTKTFPTSFSFLSVSPSRNEKILLYSHWTFFCSYLVINIMFTIAWFDWCDGGWYSKIPDIYLFIWKVWNTIFVIRRHGIILIILISFHLIFDLIWVSRDDSNVKERKLLKYQSTPWENRRSLTFNQK